MLKVWKGHASWDEHRSRLAKEWNNDTMHSIRAAAGSTQDWRRWRWNRYDKLAPLLHVNCMCGEADVARRHWLTCPIVRENQPELRDFDFGTGPPMETGLLARVLDYEAIEESGGDGMDYLQDLADGIRRAVETPGGNGTAHVATDGGAEGRRT